VKSLGEVRRMAVAPKLPVISEAATHAKVFTGGRVMAET